MRNCNRSRSVLTLLKYIPVFLTQCFDKKHKMYIQFGIWFLHAYHKLMVEIVTLALYTYLCESLISDHWKCVSWSTKPNSLKNTERSKCALSHMKKNIYQGAVLKFVLVEDTLDMGETFLSHFNKLCWCGEDCQK